MRVIRQHIFLVVAGLVVGALLGGLLALAKGPSYEARAQLYVVPETGPDAEASYNSARFSQQRMVTYVRLASSALASVSASRVGDSTVLELFATDSSGERARARVEQATARLPAMIAELGPDAVATVDVTAPAEVTSGPGYLAPIAVGLVAGLTLGLGAAAIAAGVGARRSRDIVSSPDGG